MTEDGGGTSLAPEWRRWVVENLVRGAEEADLIAILEGAGVDAAVARAAVRAEAEDPCFVGTRKALALHRKLEGLLDLYGDLHRQAEGHTRVDRHESLPREEFFERYYFQNRPVVLRGVGGAPRPPTDFMVAEESPAATQVVAGFQSPDRPIRENVLLCQVHGRLRVQLAPPFELRRMTGARGEAEAVPRLEVELGRGELLLLPVGWWYRHEAREANTWVYFWPFAASAPNVTWEQEPAPPEPSPPPRHRPS